MLHVNRSIRRLAAIGLSLGSLAPAAPAMAACSQSDLVGTWQVFFSSHYGYYSSSSTGSSGMDFTFNSSSNEGLLSWNCTIQIKPNGAFTADRSTCQGGLPIKVFGLVRPTSGPSCTYQGYLQTAGTVSARMDLTHGTLSRSKDHINGVGAFNLGLIKGAVMYSAVKL
ncbi:hypothetical protein [Geminicoccus roseus]|uniref:hypothetical protein n=1 Tax=Geminicoccus roseus TaxID=404900 RepID=UPI000481212C|nr:hypothetical protein [Geminicoccus roseus]